ncbi:MAG: hypothetical protein AAFQ98_20610, partial [Bacteroidota bacterium]
MKSLLILLLSSLLLSSCGLFLEQSGVKNYTPSQKITTAGLNDYQYDFIYLTQLVEEGFPLLEEVFPEQAREQEEEQILAALATVDNPTDFTVYMRRYLGHLENQHTNISLAQEFNEVYPYVIHISAGDWYLLNVSKQYDSLYIGKKITALNGLSTQEVGQRLSGFTFAENEINQQYEFLDLQLYNKPQYLAKAGVIPTGQATLALKFEDQSEVNLSLFSTDKELEVYGLAFAPPAVTAYQGETYLARVYPEENFGYLQYNRCHDRIDILDNIGSYVKPWLQPMARWYVRSQFKKENPSPRIANFYNPQHPVF